MALLTKTLFAFVASAILGAQALAVEVSFPPEELPNEVVVPVLDSREPVKSRLVKMTDRFDFHANMGWLLDEPFYQNRFFSVGAQYNTSEKIGFGLNYLSIGSGISEYGEQFSQTSAKLNFGKAPALKSAVTGIFQYRFLYGKVSWSKGLVTPVNYYWNTELSWANYGSRNLPWIATGVGQRLYFGKSWGTDVLMKIMYRQQINPLSKNISSNSNVVLTENDFGTKGKIGADLRLGFFYLL